MKQKIILLIFYFILSACEKEIEINLPQTNSKLVVYTQLKSGIYSNAFNGQNIIVSNSISPFSSLNNYILNEDSVPVINYANVNISETNLMDSTSINHYTFSYNDDCYCYVNQDFITKHNTTYKLTIDAENFNSINSIETVPNKPDYSISDFELLSDISENFESHLLKYDLCNLNIIINDNPNEKNYYQLNFKVGREFTNPLNFSLTEGQNLNEEKCLFKSEDVVFLNETNQNMSSLNNNTFEGNEAFFNDDSFNGQQKSIYIQVDKPQSQAEWQGAWTYFYIEIISLNESLYQFITSNEYMNNENNSQFNSEPSFNNSNINNGHGVFGVKSVSQKFYLPTVFPTNGWIEY